jgi:hypothetical protein
MCRPFARLIPETPDDHGLRAGRASSNNGGSGLISVFAVQRQSNHDRKTPITLVFNPKLKLA